MESDKVTEEEGNLSVCLVQLERMRDFEFWGSAGDLDTDHGSSLTDFSIMLRLTDFNRCFYIENKSTQKMLRFGVLPAHDAILKMHGGSSFVPRTPQETCELWIGI